MTDLWAVLQWMTLICIVLAAIIAGVSHQWLVLILATSMLLAWVADKLDDYVFGGDSE